MSLADLKERVAFAKKVKKTYPTTLWTEMVGFFLDRVSFYYKKTQQAKREPHVEECGVRSRRV